MTHHPPISTPSASLFPTTTLVLSPPRAAVAPPCLDDHQRGRVARLNSLPRHVESSMSSTPPEPVAFVLKGYPRLSETFIVQGIAALEARGQIGREHV